MELEKLESIVLGKLHNEFTNDYLKPSIDIIQFTIKATQEALNTNTVVPN